MSLFEHFLSGALLQTLPGTPCFSGTLSRALRGALRALPKTLVGGRVFLKSRVCLGESQTAHETTTATKLRLLNVLIQLPGVPRR